MYAIMFSMQRKAQLGTGAKPSFCGHVFMTKCGGVLGICGDTYMPVVSCYLLQTCTRDCHSCIQHPILIRVLVDVPEAFQFKRWSLVVHRDAVPENI